MGSHISKASNEIFKMVLDRFHPSFFVLRSEHLQSEGEFIDYASYVVMDHSKPREHSV
jgi:hypothetical protein